MLERDILIKSNILILFVYHTGTYTSILLKKEDKIFTLSQVAA